MTTHNPSTQRRLLVVAFKYPPYAEVGARRWSRLVKYLVRAGVHVEVVTVRWPAARATSHADVPGSKVHRLPSLGPHLLTNREFPESRLGRLLDRARWTIHWRLKRLGLGTEARWWGLVMVPYTAILSLARRIDTIVVTGGPFSACHAASIIPVLLPSRRLIVDYRDPWIEVPDIQELSPRRRAIQEKREARVLSRAHRVVAVTEGLAALIRGKNPAGSVEVIPNGYDQEEFAPERTTGPRTPTLIYAGNLSVGRQEPLRAFLEAMRRHQGRRPLTAIFYGGFPSRVKEEYQDLVHHGLLEVHERVRPEEVLSVVDSSFACLQFNARQFPFLVSTKVYEYAFAHRPILSVNYGGEIDRLIRDHQLGWSVHADDGEAMACALVEIAQSWESDPAEETSPQGISRYDVESEAAAYSRLLWESR